MLIPDLQFVGNKVAVVSVKEPFEQHEIDPKQKLSSQIDTLISSNMRRPASCVQGVITNRK